MFKVSSINSDLHKLKTSIKKNQKVWKDLLQFVETLHCKNVYFYWCLYIKNQYDQLMDQVFKVFWQLGPDSHTLCNLGVNIGLG